MRHKHITRIIIDMLRVLRLAKQPLNPAVGTTLDEATLTLLTTPRPVVVAVREGRG